MASYFGHCTFCSFVLVGRLPTFLLALVLQILSHDRQHSTKKRNSITLKHDSEIVSGSKIFSILFSVHPLLLTVERFTSGDLELVLVSSVD
jgi:hypothetical protein